MHYNIIVHRCLGVSIYKGLSLIYAVIMNNAEMKTNTYLENKRIQTKEVFLINYLNIFV